MAEGRGFSIRSDNGDSIATRIDIFSDIDPYFGVSAEAFLSELKHVRTDEIEVHINSGGGEVFDGIAIMNSLKDHPAKVTVIVDGLAASAASFIAVGGADHLVMQESATLMIHEAWTVAMGDAQSIEKTAAELNRVSGIIAGIYAAKAGTPVEEWREAMREESWFTAEEAVLVGLADEIRSVQRQPVASAAQKSRVLNSGSFKYRSREQAPTPGIAARAKTQEVSSAGVAGADRKEDHVSTLNEAICQRLGIPADADEATITAALEEALNERAGDDPTGTDEEGTEGDPDATTEEGPDGDADDADESAGGDDSDSDDDGSLTVTVDRATLRELQDAARYGMAARTREAAAARAARVDQAIAENRITRAARDRWIERMEADEEDTTARLNRIPKDTIPRNEIGHAAPTDDDGSDFRSKLNKAADSLYQKL
ncbi:head maturation protease, ClpP-related [Hoyosella altamirensis]|uniref:ATP-dependent Clp protease proteolytic subunit n=1 Tax=Hoyosella altamirensis TaxID=616997 RepID=A0A839RU95_9ACTN|nr:head maturation protease, ClpP-related [Hoyosella altamirensis]MBB3040140.1 ATP-dependent Clp endopeptidase proteolytic subunit ClpP [Hoyosella altamirensis]